MIYHIGHTIMQRLIAQGQNALGISVARTLSAEQFSLSYSSSSSDGINSSGAVSNTNSNSTSSEDAELILNAIITISKLITESQTKRNKVGGGNMPSLSSLSPSQETADSFSLSRDILRSITLACPESHIDKAIDLLICTDIVVAVQDRTQSKISISSASSTPSIGTANTAVSTHQNNEAQAHSMDDLNFIFSDTNYTKDGILMIPSSIQGPVMKFAQCEMQRRWTYSKSASSIKFNIITILMYCMCIPPKYF